MTKTKVRKFKFTDLALAFKVRQSMYNCLIQFDSNANQKFQKQQIIQFLMAVLGQNQIQVQYVVNNVFRYDTDGDGAITYSQFTNFCVEQHFGEMAIQRLHRKQYYLNGAKRIMNLQEFQTTLNYCLQRIQSKGTYNQYKKLFGQVDLDKDGFISYQDYFIFLKEYFGSQSQAFQQQQKNPRPIPPPKPIAQIKYTTQSAQYKLAKLIYTQFKISVMQKNSKKNLMLQKAQISEILLNILKIPYEQSDKILKSNNLTALKYEQFMKITLVNYFSVLKVKNLGKQKISQNQFVQLIDKACHFINIKPKQQLLKACFKQISRGLSVLSMADYSNIMRNVFNNYKFDMRGLPGFLLQNKNINIS